MNLVYRSSIILGFLSIFGSAAIHAQDAGAASKPARDEIPAATSPPLLSNGDFALATKDATWPDDWKKKPGITWETAKGTHYLHFAADGTGKPIELWREISIPAAQEIKAVRVSIRYRASGLICEGKGSGARTTFRFFDAVKIAFSDSPPPLGFSSYSEDWKEATTTLPVPANAVTLEMFIGLFQVAAGTFDLAGISVKPVPGAVASTPATKPDPSAPTNSGASVPVRREENHTIIGYGKPSVWFIHPYVDVLGHDFALGITNLVTEARDQGHPVAVGVSNNLDDSTLQDEANTIYVFSYKNINFPLPANARRMVFLNTWLTPPVVWPPSRTGKKDLVLIGSRMLHNDGDGLASNKDRWTLIQKDDPTLAYTVLDSAGYYLPIATWRVPLLNVVLEEQSAGK